MPKLEIFKKISLKGYKLSFSHKTNYTTYGHANIIKNNNSLVQGALWNISKKDEKNLDYYEGIDYNYYYKDYFKINSKSFSIQTKNLFFKKTKQNLFKHIIEGYEDCGLDLLYLKK